MGKFSLTNMSTQTGNDINFKNAMEIHFNESSGEIIDKLGSFTRYVSRQNLSTFLAKHEIFKKVLEIHGSVIECGVFNGSGLMTWAQLSSIYEPLNHNRLIIGFDSFSGFPTLSDFDLKEGFDHNRVGAYAFPYLEELKKSIELFDLNRPLGHMQKVNLVKGNALETIPSYIKDNQHLVVSLLYLDFDLYESTKVAIEYFFPRMPKGAIIAFDELNQKQWPGETKALIDTIGINSLKIERFPFMPQISFAQI
jgi:hypothetical protein